MSAGKTSPTDLLGHLFPSASRRGRFLKHPTESALVDFVQDRLPPLAKAAVRMHLRRCDRCLETVEDIRDLNDPISTAEAETEAPRPLRELLFAQAARDIALRVEQTLLRHGRAVRIVPRLTVVPSFFKKDRLPSGIAPQAYLSGLMEAVGQILPNHSTAGLGSQVSGKMEMFVLRADCLSEPCGISESHLHMGSGAQAKTVDGVVFLALHPLWTPEKIGLCPAACRLPMRAVPHFLGAVTGESVLAINDLFRQCPSCRWRPHGEAVLREFVHFLRQALQEATLGSLLSPPAETDEEEYILPVADLTARFRAEQGAGLREVTDLRSILGKRQEQVGRTPAREGMFTQFPSHFQQA